MERISRFWGRIGTRLYLALAFAVFLTLVSGWVGAWHFGRSGEHTYRVRDESVPVLESSWQVYGDAQILRRMGMARLGAIDSSDVHAAEARINDGLRQVSVVPDLQPVAGRVGRQRSRSGRSCRRIDHWPGARWPVPLRKWRT